MSYKMTGKILTDLVMTILLLLLMARQITGDSAHEWLGAAMFVLWVLHHVFNFRWYTHLLPGKAEPLKKLYPPARIVRIIVNFLLLLSMLGTMISGVILSREVFDFLPISGGIALAGQCMFYALSGALSLWQCILGSIGAWFLPCFAGSGGRFHLNF